MSHELLTHLHLPAPIERVSAVLLDTPGWRRWSRMLWFDGPQLRVGDKVRMRLRVHGRTVAIPIRVETCDAGSLSWSGGPRRLLWGTHWLRLTAEGEGTLLEHGERFGGLVTPLLFPLLSSRVVELHSLINEDLRAEVERCAALGVDS